MVLTVTTVMLGKSLTRLKTAVKRSERGGLVVWDARGIATFCGAEVGAVGEAFDGPRGVDGPGAANSTEAVDGPGAVGGPDALRRTGGLSIVCGVTVGTVVETVDGPETVGGPETIRRTDGIAILCQVDAGIPADVVGSPEPVEGPEVAVR